MNKTGRSKKRTPGIHDSLASQTPGIRESPVSQMKASWLEVKKNSITKRIPGVRDTGDSRLPGVWDTGNQQLPTKIKKSPATVPLSPSPLRLLSLSQLSQKSHKSRITLLKTILSFIRNKPSKSLTMLHIPTFRIDYDISIFSSFNNHATSGVNEFI